ncbi:MAG: hypothetical protein ACJ8LG_24010 [Massilia sp.]
MEQTGARRCARGRICSAVFAILFAIATGSAGPASAQGGAPVSIKLFEATPVRSGGENTSPDRAIPFGTRSIILTKEAGDSAVLSSTPDGTGGIVIDNFLTINGRNACEGAPGQLYADSCFGPVLDTALPINVQIETVLTPIPPVNVAAQIPNGTTSVVFELRDYGSIAGNTDLYLVTTSKRPPPPLTASWNGTNLTVASPAPEARNATLNITGQPNILQASVTLENKPVLTIAQQISGANGPPSPVQATYAQTFLGVPAAFDVSQFVLNGQLAGRAIATLPITPGSVVAGASFRDAQPPPPVSVTSEDMLAMSAFARTLERELPSMVPVLAGTCSEGCIETACDATKNAGFEVRVVRTAAGTQCEGTSTAAAAEEYRQQFNQCYQSRCSLLGRLLTEGASFLPYQLSRIFEATSDVTTIGRRNR